LRSLRVNFLLIYPQQEQVFEDGAKRPIRKMFLPYHCALYSNIVTNVDQLASDIDCANEWFFIILLTAKSSKQIVWFSRINLVDILCSPREHHRMNQVESLPQGSGRQARKVFGHYREENQ